MSTRLLINEVVPFVPSKDFATSVRFYSELFDVDWRTEQLCQIQAGRSKFLIQNYYDEGWAKNAMFQMLVDDADAIWNQLETSGVLTRYVGVRAQPPKQETWGRVVYLWGPAGELWHLTQLR